MDMITFGFRRNTELEAHYYCSCIVFASIKMIHRNLFDLETLAQTKLHEMLSRWNATTFKATDNLKKSHVNSGINEVWMKKPEWRFFSPNQWWNVWSNGGEQLLTIFRGFKKRMLRKGAQYCRHRKHHRAMWFESSSHVEKEAKPCDGARKVNAVTK